MGATETKGPEMDPATTDRPTPQDQLRISKRIERTFLGAIGALSVIAASGLVGYYAGNNNQTYHSGNMPMMSGYGAAQAPQSVTVAMHDPGCHWFQVGTSLRKTLAVTGPVSLLNSDEAAVKIAGANGTVKDAVGQRVALTPGSYTITMVGQAPDDNTLHLGVS
jgi:hypothetical protein